MSAQGSAPAHDLTRFVALLQQLDEEGIEYVVIGGCAVGAYARLSGEAVFSADLDLYLSESSLEELLSWARDHAMTIEKLPQPRSVPVAVLRWKGLEVNALTASEGLPPIDDALHSCREFTLEGSTLPVYVADPFDLLANKLRLRRQKDAPHIEVLTRYLELEVREVFAGPGSPRERWAPAKRLMQVMGLAGLPDRLALELIPLAHTRPLRRFLAGRISSPTLVNQLLATAESDAERAELGSIVARHKRIGE
jgi:hypothetical protein